MANRASKHIVDHLAEWAGSLIFTAGMALAAWRIFDPKIAVVVALASFTIAIRLLSHIGSKPSSNAPFEPAELGFEGADGALPQPANDELLLDDPLVARPDSRATRLFASEDKSPAALVARIEDYLDREPQRKNAVQEVRRDEPVPDASAALHTALANIRASLR